MSIENIMKESEAIHCDILEKIEFLPVEYRGQIFSNMLTCEMVSGELHSTFKEKQADLSSSDLQVFHRNILSLNTTYNKIRDMISSVIEGYNKSCLPMLSSLMNMLPDDISHPDIIRVRKWIAHPEHSLEDNKYFIIYAARAVAEALAIHCHVLKDNLEQLVWIYIPFFEKVFDRNIYNFGFVSKRFNLWIVHTVGDPEMCPNSELRLKMILLYRLLKIDDDNRELALKSVLFACSSLNRNKEKGVAMLTDEVFYCLDLFGDCDELDDNYLYQFSLQLKEKLRHNQRLREQIIIHDISFEYAMGLKKIVEPREILGLTAILKYINDQVSIDYKAFQEDPHNESYIRNITESLSRLNRIVYPFKPILEEPELINITTECVMNVTDYAIRSKYRKSQDDNEDSGDDLWEVNLTFIDLADKKGTDKIGHGRVGKEIIRRYKERICRLRLDIPKVFIEGESNEYLCDIIYNGKY